MNVNTIAYVLAALALFMSGYNAHGYLHTCPEAKPVILTEYKDRVQTEVTYAEKESGERADINISVGKPELNVKVNDKEFASLMMNNTSLTKINCPSPRQAVLILILLYLPWTRQNVMKLVSVFTRMAQ